MWAWIPIAGTTEYALRLPSALISTLAIPAIWRVARDLFDARTAFAAALLMSIANLALEYGREARMYGTVMALSALVFLATARVASRGARGDEVPSYREGARGAARWREPPRRLPGEPIGASQPERERPSLGRRGARRLPGAHWATFALIAAVAVLTHYTALAAWVAAALYLMLGRERRVWPWLLANGAVALIAAAWAVQLWRSRAHWQNLVWLPWAAQTTPPRAILDWVTAFAGPAIGPNGFGHLAAPEAVARLAAGALFVASLALGIARTWRAGHRHGAIALAALAIGSVLALATLEPFRATWHVRFALVGLPAALLLAAVGAPRVLLAALIGAQLWGVYDSGQVRRDDWRAVAGLVRQHVQPGDVALGGVGSLVGYYLSPILPVYQRPVAIGRAPEDAAAELARVEGARALWMVPRIDPLMDPSDLIGTLVSRAATGQTPYEAGGIHLARVELRPGVALRPPSLAPIDATFGNALRLTGYSLTRTGTAVSLSTELVVTNSMTEDYKLFAHLLDSTGRTVAQRDVLVYDDARRTTSAMPVGTRLRLELTIDGAGDRVGVGLYDERTGERLAIAPPASEHRLILAL